MLTDMRAAGNLGEKSNAALSGVESKRDLGPHAVDFKGSLTQSGVGEGVGSAGPSFLFSSSVGQSAH